MIELLDTFVDTKEKRRHLLYVITLLFCIFLLLPYVYLGLRLLLLNDYASVFALLNEAVISKTYVARVVLDVLSSATMSMAAVVSILLDELRMVEIVTLLLLVLLFPHVADQAIVSRLLILALAGICGVLGCLVLGFQSTSLGQAVFYLHGIGMIFLLVGLVMLIVLVIYLQLQLHRYHTALQVSVEEIQE